MEHTPTDDIIEKLEIQDEEMEWKKSMQTR